MRTAKVREHWASGTVAVQLKTGKKGKLQVKHSSVLAATAGAGLSQCSQAPGAGLAAHRDNGGKKLGFLETPAWGCRGRQAVLCSESKVMGTLGSSE